jgi:hypothetical protein
MDYEKKLKLQFILKEMLISVIYATVSGLTAIIILIIYGRKLGTSLSYINISSQTTIPFQVNSVIHGCQIIIELFIISMIALSLLKAIWQSLYVIFIKNNEK